ncbi:MAG: hypothetical protein J7K26_02205 [Candidatus Aenigmarchaeota archaeon]|nr:hypothetical protein [Candidatus Aenigmarchaeota archaeon]
MKAISAVIAIVLILIITVGLVSLAYMWFTGMFRGLSNMISERTKQVSEHMQADFSIESISSDLSTIYIRNTGNTDLTNFTIYKNGKILIKDKDYTLSTDKIKPSDILEIYISFSIGDKILITTRENVKKQVVIEVNSDTGEPEPIPVPEPPQLPGSDIIIHPR